jgi:hypothetical protein
MLLVSIFVKYDPWGRMGNRMLQYAFGAILSEIKNTDFFHDGLPNFNISPSIKQISNNYINTKSFGNNKVDMKILKNTTHDILVDSYVQKAEYYLPYQQKLKTIFNIKEYSTNPDKLVLHIRETDYTQINNFLGYDFYKNLIKFSNFTNILIVTDNSNCETVQRLLSEGCVLNTPGYVDKFTHSSDERGMHDFFTLVYSENIALSQSTFSWWGALLGTHNRIIFPYSTKHNNWPLNPGEDDIDLFLDKPESIKFIN